MNVLIINEVCGHTSTGKICAELAEKYEADGCNVKIAYGRDDFVPDRYKKYAVRIGSNVDVKLHALYTRITDKHGLGSVEATKRFLTWADKFNPKVVWLHNLHGYYINYELLFSWIKSRPNMEVKWTLHDCWSFTGHCSHFTYVNCDKWKNGCYKCPQKKEYPRSLFADNCEENYKRKKAAFTGVNDLTIFTPSNWLKEKVQESFLSNYSVVVRHNSINTEVFKPTPSNFRKKYDVNGKIVVLGVANVWNERKGLNDFFQLASMLGKDYAIVLVGLKQKQIDAVPRKISGFHRIKNDADQAQVFVSIDMLTNSINQEKIDKPKGEHLVKDYENSVVEQGIQNLYKAITGLDYVKSGCGNVCKLICIPKTNNVGDLVKIYSACDLFVNPTYEDTYPTVNLEAIACGTKVITYNTGGSKETIMR